MHRAAMAPPNEEAATTPLEVATHFPGSTGLRLPRDEPISVDASALFDVIARMGGAIAKLQDDLQTVPPWVADVSEKLKRMDKLDRGFSSLTDVVGDLMSVTNVQDEAIIEDMDAIKKEACRSDKEKELQTVDAFQLAQFNALKGRLDAFENKQACAPAYEDVEQLKDYTRERSKKLKATLVSMQAQMERKFDQRLKDQIGNFGMWQANLTQVNSGRQQVLEDKIEENYATFAEFRKHVNKSVKDSVDATTENNLWAKREFSTVNSQTLQLQAVLHDVVTRLDAAEKNVAAKALVVDTLVDTTKKQLATFSLKAQEAEERVLAVEKKLIEGDKRADLLEEDAKGQACDIQVLQERLQKLDDDLGNEMVARQATDTLLDEVKLKVDVIEFKAVQERNERIGDVKRVSEEAKGLAHRVEELAELEALVKHVDNLTRFHPDKLEFLEEEIGDIKDTLLEGAEMNEALKQGLKDMKLQQEANKQIQKEIQQITTTVQKQEEKQTELVKVQEEAKEEAQKILHIQEEAAEYAKEVAESVALVELKAQEAEEQVKEQVKVMKADAKASEEKLQEIIAVVEDDDPTGIPGQNKPGMASSMASRPPEQQQKFMDNEAIGVAKACFEFETLCNAKNCIPDLSQQAIMAIASSTLEMASFIAGRVDRWALGQQMMDRPADDPFGDHHVADQAQKECQVWISDTEVRVKELAGSNDVVTPLQLIGRELFFDKCSHALRSGLTKHDQVMVVDKSAIKHSQNIPTCVACNRVLPTKQSKGENVRKSRAAARPPSAKVHKRKEKDDPEYVMRGGFKLPASLDGKDPASHASMSPLRPREAGKAGDLVGAWNAEEAGA